MTADAQDRIDRFKEILPLLRCPDCKDTLEIRDSRLLCSACRKEYPLAGRVIQFVPSEGYATNFGFEWSRYARTQMDHEASHVSEESFRARTGFLPDELRGKWVLDVGCGMGRFAEVASRWGANVVAVDLSRAAEVAARNLGDCDNVWVCRADLFRLPFAPECFDFIYSLGVLHHTPDCERAFKGLPQFLRPGGSIAIWLYSAYHNWYRMSDLYRRFTTRLPARWLHALCQLAACLYYLHAGLRRVPVLGRVLAAAIIYLLPISLHPKWEWRVLDTFDWYSPTYQSKHTYEEVFRWFEDCGLGDLRVLFETVAVQGRKPLRAAEPALRAETWAFLRSASES